jgi:hypothetical protein
VRTLVLVAALTVLTAIVVAVTAPERAATDARVTSLTVPAAAVAGERLSVRGSVLLPDDEVLDRRFRYCHLETGACSTAGWGSVTGPGHWTGFAGDLRVSEAGTYRVTWALHAPWGSDTTRAASRAHAKVIVRAAPE